MTVKNKFQLKREATYRKLLEAGMACFAEKGYASTTLSDIVARTGQTKGAFYGHFPSKEQLFLHVLDYQMQLTAGWMNVPKQFDPRETTLAEVLAITLERLSQMLGGAENWILVLIDFHLQTKQDPAMQDKLKAKYGEWLGGIEELVAVLQEKGWVAPDKDVREIAMQTIAFNEGYTIFSALFGGTNSHALIQGLVKLME
ncbi:MAG: TetR/AcrR family transcriptional regulator [Paenibacillaceae bacterium]|nr:TetR/AcrR family transcriptional regulator [Paenibacillaceae bacterium]